MQIKMLLKFKISSFIQYFVLCFLLFLSISIKSQTNTSLLGLVPYPNEIKIPENSFYVWNDEFKIYISSKKLNSSVESLDEFLRLLKLKRLKKVYLSDTNWSQISRNYSGIAVYLDSSVDSNSENYSLKINKNTILVSGSVKGCFYGIQTLKQLIFNSKIQKDKKILIPILEINDAPYLEYRGFHLDVSRHFFSVSEIKKLIDIMSYFKLNIFHWHLNDDQGWRVEIKKYPKLTSIGSIRKETMVEKNFHPDYVGDGIEYGPFFYTQNEIKDIVNYAYKRNINIIPEIDVPGHSTAVIASYPELGYEKYPQEVLTYWGNSSYGVLNVGKDTVFKFLENVFDEIITLFPYKYIHIGGDEVSKIAWKKDSFCIMRQKKENLKNEHQLQSYFTNRVERYLRSKGKTIIGWDEILDFVIPDNTCVMSWRGEKNGIEAANKNYKVIMVPERRFYLDHYQSISNSEPLAIGGLNTIERVYNYDPIPKNIKNENRKKIWGAQVNMWTEYIKNPEHLEYMYFPRALSFSETAWTIPEKKNYTSFYTRVKKSLKYLDYKKTNYSKNVFNVKAEYKLVNGALNVKLISYDTSLVLRYTTNGSQVTKNSSISDSILTISNTTTLKVRLFKKNDEPYGEEWNQKYLCHKAFSKKVYIKKYPEHRYVNPTEASILVNGIFGNNYYNDGQWLKFFKDSMDIIIDLEKIEEFDSVSMNFIYSPTANIYLPGNIEIYISNDSIHYEKVSDEIIITKNKRYSYVKIFDSKKQARFIKIIASNTSNMHIKGNEQGERPKTWIFVDEIAIE